MDANKLVTVHNTPAMSPPATRAPRSAVPPQHRGNSRIAAARLRLDAGHYDQPDLIDEMIDQFVDRLLADLDEA